MDWDKLVSCIDWLARFHALHWERPFDPDGELWPEGCYWRLDTRMDEFESMGIKWARLRSAARSIADLLRDGTHSTIDAPFRHRTFVHGDFKSANLQFAARNAQRSAPVDAKDKDKALMVLLMEDPPLHRSNAPWWISSTRGVVTVPGTS